MSARTQAKLLRVLQDGLVTRVGGASAIKVDVRVVAATNRELPAAVAAGTFREDLYYRLAVVPLAVPPLRERTEDLAMLADHFLALLAKSMGRKPRRLERGALALLARHAWPGNVRELRNLLERLVILTPGEAITEADVARHLPGVGHRAPAGAPRPRPRPTGGTGRTIRPRRRPRPRGPSRRSSTPPSGWRSRPRSARPAAWPGRPSCWASNAATSTRSSASTACRTSRPAADLPSSHALAHVDWAAPRGRHPGPRRAAHPTPPWPEIFLLTIVVITTIVPTMKRHLQSEIRQTRPFASLEEEVYLQVLRTAQVAHRWCLEELKPLGISPSQFNVLRILRGARPGALSSRVIAERMIQRDPDLTRMLDRLEAMGLVEKTRSTTDRRVVEVTVTKAGAEIAEKGARAVREVLAERLATLGPKKLEQLANLLDQARGAVELNEEEAVR